MQITLPDASVVNLNPKTLQFTAVDPSSKASVAELTLETPQIGGNCKVLAECLTDPDWKFGDCFRRISDHPRYSPKQSVHEFDITRLARMYQFRGSYQGGTFCSSTTEWRFLDGGILSHYGYGWGSHSWTLVEGAESLRAVCLFFGIRQPQTIKGELERRPLSILLQDMTSVPLQVGNGQL